MLLPAKRCTHACMQESRSPCLICAGMVGMHPVLSAMIPCAEILQRRFPYTCSGTGAVRSQAQGLPMTCCRAERGMPAARGQVLVGTGKHRLRLYDVRPQRRPALDVEFGSARVTALAVDPSGARAPRVKGLARSARSHSYSLAAAPPRLLACASSITPLASCRTVQSTATGS